MSFGPPGSSLSANDSSYVYDPANADRRWPQALKTLQGSEEQQRYEIVKTTHDVADIDLAYDTIIEVFDPVRKALLASTRTDELYRFSVGPNRVSRLRRTSDGSLVPEIWLVRLHSALGTRHSGGLTHLNAGRFGTVPHTAGRRSFPSERRRFLFPMRRERTPAICRPR